jgi:hypothetical protein
MLATVALTFTASSHVIAQSSMPPDIRAKMNGYVGTWDVEEQLRDSPGGSEKTARGTWEARWAADDRIEWLSTSTTDGRTVTSVEHEGYDPVMQVYTYWLSSDGERGHAYDGEWDGNTLRLQFVQTTAEGAQVRGRCTWPYNADFTELASYSCEKLTDGEWWVFRSGTATKRGG